MYSNSCCREWGEGDTWAGRQVRWDFTGPKMRDRYYFRYLLEIINAKLHIASIIPWIIIALKYYLLQIGLRPSSYDRGGAQIENNQWGIKNVTRRRAGSRATWREANRVSLHIPACRPNCMQKLFGTTTRKCSSRTVECPWYLTSVLSHYSVRWPSVVVLWWQKNKPFVMYLCV